MESAGVRYLCTRFCIRNLTRSLRKLVRFLIRQQLVRKYRTPALSMKYSLFILLALIVYHKAVFGCHLYQEQQRILISNGAYMASLWINYFRNES